MPSPEMVGSRLSQLATTAQVDDSVLLSVADVCDWLDLSYSTVNELVLAGRLASIKLGRSRRIPVGAVRAFVAGLAAPADCHTPGA